MKARTRLVHWQPRARVVYGTWWIGWQTRPIRQLGAQWQEQDFEDYKTIRDHVMASSPSLTLWWEITNGYKHCELKGHTMTASQIDRAALSAPSNSPPNHPLVYRFVPKVKTKAGANLSVLDVYKDALAYWEAFLTRVGL